MIATLGQAPVARGSLTIPLTGLWRADVVLARAAADAPVQRGDAATLDLAGTAYVGTVTQAGPERGLWRAVLVAGQGQMGQPVKPKTYQGMDALGILRDTLGEVGEELDGASDLNYSPNSWVRLAGPAYGAVAALVRAAGGNWRATASGTIWAGVDAWDGYSPQTPVLDEGVGRVTLVLDPAILPGASLDGYGRVIEVTHAWDASRARTEVRYDPA